MATNRFPGNGPPEPRGTRDAPGGVSLSVLGVATAATVVVVAGLFFLARAPLAEAFGIDRLDALVTEARAEALADAVDDSAASASSPAMVAPADPGEASVREVDPQWNLPRVQQAVKACAEAVEVLIPQGRDELGQLDRLDEGDSVRADRAQRQFDTWGRTWINRLRSVAKDLPTEADCAVHVSMAPKCKALRLALAEAAHAPKEKSLEGAVARLDGAAERIDTMLRPPPSEESDDDDGEDSAEESEG